MDYLFESGVTGAPRKAVPLLFLDVDGTVRHGPAERGGRFVNSPGDVRVFGEAVAQMARWQARGGRIAAVSNQGGIALGHVTEQDAMAAMRVTAVQAGNLFDVVLWCSHHPDAARPELARCWCRKPKPGLLIKAVFELAAQHPDEWYPPHMSLMVGDRPEDRDCAAAAGVDFMDAADWRASA